MALSGAVILGSNPLRWTDDLAHGRLCRTVAQVPQDLDEAVVAGVKRLPRIGQADDLGGWSRSAPGFVDMADDSEASCGSDCGLDVLGRDNGKRSGEQQLSEGTGRGCGGGGGGRVDHVGDCAYENRRLFSQGIKVLIKEDRL